MLDVMYSIGLYKNHTGLCNQLFSLVAGVLKAKKLGHVSAKVGTFSVEINSNKWVMIDQILNLEKTGAKMDFQLVSGTSNGPLQPWTVLDQDKYIYSIRCIRFKQVFYDIAQELYFKNISGDEPLHVVHFRIEGDGIIHWRVINKMTADIFAQTLHDQYRKAITMNIPPGSQLLALTSEINHPLLQELGKQYRIIAFDTQKLISERVGFTGREVCAIIDLILGTRCSGVFVGCHNFILKRGSTFSYTLWQLMKNAKQGVFMDLDDITHPLQTWFR